MLLKVAGGGQCSAPWTDLGGGRGFITKTYTVFRVDILHLRTYINFEHPEQETKRRT